MPEEWRRNLEKAYDRVPIEELWYCMRKPGVAEKYVRVVQDMYERSRTMVRCAVGQTEEFKVEVGLHQGSALRPFLFTMVMDQLSEEVRQESPWAMMFADDIVICSESREQVEENLERWRFALERRGMKVSRSKTEYMCVNEREGSGTVRLQGEEVKKVQEFKYLGSTVQSNGECGKEVKKREQAGWNGWRKVSGVLCERKISARIKGKVYRTVVRPAMLYGLETVSLRKRQESELEVAELKMLRFSLGVTRLDRIRNEYIRGTAHVGRLGDKVREARLRWFGHVQRRENGEVNDWLESDCDRCSIPPNTVYLALETEENTNEIPDGLERDRNEKRNPLGMILFVLGILSRRRTGEMGVPSWYYKVDMRVPMMKSTEVEQGLFTDTYCKVCSAQLISESQRVAHYESRKHANKVRLYYMLHPVDGGCPAKKLRTHNGSEEGDVDKNKCCTLCNMSFTSAVVAQSHYQGKIHAKRLKLVLGEQPSITGKVTGPERGLEEEEVAFGCSLFGVATEDQLVRTTTWQMFYTRCPS
ncbi:hypothetical protein QTP70_005264 [Hemibagrus guttatus]|uniref:ribonuclease H n=1 Tax=Hemibagrus guttatus TaxID=175788 RepID=A0AAE0UNT0_9TELE|nr:hypothetical protein QTP70_005264 [Hemibagrus guttatus]